MPVPGATGAIVVYEHTHFRGRYRLIWSEENNLNRPEDFSLNDAISSFVVMDGNWKFYRDRDFGTPYNNEFGPGVYPSVKDIGIENNKISSLKAVSENNTPGALPGLPGAVIVFEHEDFRGHQRIIWGEERNLSHPADHCLDGSIGSFVVMYGNWQFFHQHDFQSPYNRIFTPGAYRSAAAAGLEARHVLSLRAMTEQVAPARGTFVAYEHPNFRGRYRIICNEEKNLGHPADPSLSGKMSSFVVMQGNWKLYRNAEFDAPYAREFGPGLYNSVAELGIEDGQIASLQAL
jgi:hypothetical protein